MLNGESIVLYDARGACGLWRSGVTFQGCYRADAPPGGRAAGPQLPAASADNSWFYV